MYCKRCDRDDVGNFHRCFIGLNAIRPLKKRPNPNTKLVRRLAELYEYFTRFSFPGGIRNARIISNGRLSSDAAAEGTWSWYLASIDSSYGNPYYFGSTYTATECAKQPVVKLEILFYNGEHELCIKEN